MERGIYCLRSIDDFTKCGCFLRGIKTLLYEAWKEGKVFFRRRLKNGMYIKISCIAKKWITKPFIYYIQNPWAPTITSIVQQMLHSYFGNVFTNSYSSSFKTLSAASVSSWVTTSSIIVSAMLVISVDSFASGSANDSKGSGRGDSSAAVENVNQFEATKINNKVKPL